MDNKIKNQKIGSKKYSFPSRGRWCEAPDEVCKKGISLISLIITIIVIIILVAIVIFEGFGATESAEFARFTQEFSDYQERVAQEYRNKKTNNAIDRIKKKDSEIYKEIAGGEEYDVNSLLSGETILSGLKGTKCYKIQDDRELYEGQTGIYITDKGEVFTLPGYEYTTNNETHYYVTSSKYYLGDGIVAPGGSQEENPSQVEMATTLDSGDSSAAMWNLLGEIAKVISIQGTSSSSTTAQTVVNGQTYNLSVGQEFTVRYNNEDERVRILGFNHDDLANPNAYGIAATKAGISFEFVNETEERKMNSASPSTNAGSWEESEMRAYLSGEGLNKMDNATKNVIKAIKKPSIKGYRDTTAGSWSGEMGTTTDKLWLLSKVEVFNTTISGAPAPQKEGTQYAFYVGKTNEDRIKKLTETDEVKWWWFRSPSCGNRNCFCGVSGVGTFGDNYASTPLGVSAGFSI